MIALTIIDPSPKSFRRDFFTHDLSDTVRFAVRMAASHHSTFNWQHGKITDREMRFHLKQRFHSREFHAIIIEETGPARGKPYPSRINLGPGPSRRGAVMSENAGYAE